MLMAATGLVLLIACVNIANLTSAQAVARSGELSLRLALGASRRDVLRMGLAELLIVCLAGLIPGLLLARGAVPALLAINPTIARTLGEVSIDWRVQAFSALIAVLAAVAASVVPAMRAMRGQASTVLAATGSRTTGSAARGPRAARAGLDRSGAVRRAADGGRRRHPGPARAVDARAGLSISGSADGANPTAGSLLPDAATAGDGRQQAAR